MKTNTLPLFAILLALLACAFGVTARQNTSWPAVKSTWQDVRKDVDRGFATAAANESPPTAARDALDEAVKQDRHEAAAAVDWSALKPWALRGIEAAPHSEGVKGSLREQLKNFDAVMVQLQRRPQ